MKKRLISIVLALALLLGLASAASAATASQVSSAVTGTAGYVYRNTSAPTLGAIGGEWAVLGLARSGYSVPDKYYQDYYAAVEKYVVEKSGVLDSRKYTEYSRVVIALSALGMDPTDVGGYNLLTPLADFDQVIWQGLNGPIWALIALDSKGYAMPTAPAGKTQASKQMYVNYILGKQLSDGGWNLIGSGASDVDITGMALQALAKYKSQSAVSTAIDKALDCLSKMQNGDGSFNYYATTENATSESCAQVVVALAELGISQTDSRFVKNGKSALDALLSYRQSGGSFIHSRTESGDNRMSTEQGFYALVAAKRAMNGQNSLYRMSDSLSISKPASQTPGSGLPGKNPAVTAVPVTAPGTTFYDVSGHKNQTAIEALAARGIINGVGDGTFKPNDNMDRAQFAAITVRALGLTPQAVNVFSDVPSTAWYAPYVGTAYTYGIVNGVGEGKFIPVYNTPNGPDKNGYISREQAATMVARAAKLCGMNTTYSDAAARDVLAGFSDYTKVSSWALGSVAFCYDHGILDSSALSIQPEVYIKRCEIAQMLYNMLKKANLIA